jgi:HlyD family secretion protein
MNRSWLLALATIVLVALGSYGFYAVTRPEPLPEGFLYGNGRIEGTEIRIASEVAGRVMELRIPEGEDVSAGTVLLTIDPTTPRNKLRVVEAELQALEESRGALAAQITTWAHHLETARSQVVPFGATRPERSRERAKPRPGAGPGAASRR